ncbi:MAG: hypothetical protein IGS50_19890 [Synechococcales cyanobacterium C42_A2020_086]|nr:hypothetical protein [Synechococcales cyanobacterium M58_A2018_015]MBF2076001.1 hypothetical protein [Synechococcales cyanobacterium C42_A2020_086]
MRLTMFTANRARFTLLAITLGMLVTSCSESKVSQCNKLIEIANRAVEGVQTASENPRPDSIESMNKIADVANNARSEMEALQLTDERLQGYQTRFVTMYTATNQATRELVTAAQAKDAEGAQRAFEALQTATAQEEPLVNEVNAYCEPQSASPVPTPASPASP